MDWAYAPGAPARFIGLPGRVNRVARTLADLERAERITGAHAEEALALYGREEA